MVLNPVGTKQGFLNLSMKKQSPEQGKCRYKRSGGMMLAFSSLAPRVTLLTGFFPDSKVSKFLHKAESHMIQDD